MTHYVFLLAMILSGCASGYDAQGNGTSVWDKSVRYAIHAVNGEHY